MEIRMHYAYQTKTQLFNLIITNKIFLLKLPVNITYFKYRDYINNLY